MRASSTEGATCPGQFVAFTLLVPERAATFSPCLPLPGQAFEEAVGTWPQLGALVTVKQVIW